MIQNSLFLLQGLTEEEVARCYQMAQTEELSFGKGDTVYDAHSVRRALALVLEGHLQIGRAHV